MSKVDPEVFLEKFGVGVDSADSLIQAKTLTISKLMSILPPETIDPRLVTRCYFNKLMYFVPYLRLYIQLKCPALPMEFLKKLEKQISNLEEKNTFFNLCFPQCTHVGSLKNVSQFGLAVWPAIANTYTKKYLISKK